MYRQIHRQLDQVQHSGGSRISQKGRQLFGGMQPIIFAETRMKMKEFGVLTFQFLCARILSQGVQYC